MTEAYRTKDVARLARVTLRQLQFWDETGVLRPVQDARTRFYNEEQLQSAIRLGKMRAAGVTLQKARVLLRSRLRWNTVVRVWRPTVIGTTLVVPR